MKHLLSIEALSATEIREIIAQTAIMKAARGRHDSQPLAAQCWALIFSKASTRTRVSFEVGVRELGGDAMFLSAADIQLGRGEPIEDTARVMGRMVHGAIIRTFDQRDVEDFAEFSGIPTINALTDAEHPCQILADLFSIQESLGAFDGKTICFIGDGACNVAYSWIWAAAKLGLKMRIAAPRQYQPAAGILEAIGDAEIELFEDPVEAAKGADVLYTDVWVSMGKESEAQYRMAQLARFQIDSNAVNAAKPGALVMHCLPAYRGKEISEEVFEANAATIFTQAENRLHAQKAIMERLAGELRADG